MKPETLLHRQVHPNFVDRGQVTSQAFLPFPKDNGELSVYDGSRISAIDSFFHYTESLGLESVAVWSISCEEAHTEGVPPKPAPLEGFPEHAVIDFNAAEPKSWRKIAKKLKRKALDRGCQYSP